MKAVESTVYKSWVHLVRQSFEGAALQFKVVFFKLVFYLFFLLHSHGVMGKGHKVWVRALGQYLCCQFLKIEAFPYLFL